MPYEPNSLFSSFLALFSLVFLFYIFITTELNKYKNWRKTTIPSPTCTPTFKPVRLTFISSICFLYSISWSTYYLPERYQVDFEPPTPLVRDPANAGINIGSTLPYWGQFRTELIIWLKSLGVTVCNVDS